MSGIGEKLTTDASLFKLAAASDGGKLSTLADRSGNAIRRRPPHPLIYEYHNQVGAGNR